VDCSTTRRSETVYRQWRSKRWIIVGCVSSAFIVPMLLGAKDASLDTRQSHRKEIEAMSETKRARLKRNFAVFKKLETNEPDRFRQIRELHRAVEQDSELRKVMDAYYSWLATLSPWRREELRKQNDTQNRLQLIQKFKDEQEGRRAGRQDLFFGEFSRSVGVSPFLRNVPKLSPEDVAAVMNVIERHLQLSQQQRKNLQSMSQLERHLHMLERLSRSRVPNRSDRSFRDLSNLTNEMIDAISDQQVRQWLQSRRFSEQGRAFQRLVVGALLRERQVKNQRHKPSDQELQAYFLNLSLKDRDEIMQLRPDQAKAALMRKYIAANRDEFGPSLVELRRLIQRIFPRARSRSLGSDGRLRPREGVRSEMTFDERTDHRDSPKRRQNPSPRERN